MNLGRFGTGCGPAARRGFETAGGRVGWVWGTVEGNKFGRKKGVFPSLSAGDDAFSAVAAMFSRVRTAHAAAVFHGTTRPSPSAGVRPLLHHPGRQVPRTLR